MRRLSAPLLAVVVASVAGFMLFGRVLGGAGLVLTGTPLLALLMVALRGTRVRTAPDLGWHRSPSGPGAPGGAVTAGLPPGIAVTAAPRPLSSPRRLAAALARAESGRFVVDQWFGAGLGFCVLTLVLFAWVGAPQDVGHPWRLVFADLPVMAHPMAGMAVVAAHRAATRARREGAAELFDTCPLLRRPAQPPTCSPAGCRPPPWPCSAPPTWC